MLLPLVLLGVLAALYLLVVTCFVILERRLVFRPRITAQSVVAPANTPVIPHADVTLSTTDGVTLQGWVIPAAESPAVAPWLLFLHGNAGRVEEHLPRYQQWHKLGFNVLAVDYRGYGRSQGVPSERGLYLDAHACYNHLTETRKVAPQRIVVYGFSMGAAVALELCTRQRVAAVIVEGAFTSVPDVGQERYPFLPIRWLARNRFDALSRVRRLSVPLMVIHSLDDTEIRPHHGRAIFAAASQPKVLLEVKGQHDDACVEDGERICEGVGKFLRMHAGLTVKVS
jgi:fermentation-respiration switch protein FrsA (DUF1100 family)